MSSMCQSTVLSLYRKKIPIVPKGGAGAPGTSQPGASEAVSNAPAINPDILGLVPSVEAVPGAPSASDASAPAVPVTRLTAAQKSRALQATLRASGKPVRGKNQARGRARGGGTGMFCAGSLNTGLDNDYR